MHIFQEELIIRINYNAGVKTALSMLGTRKVDSKGL
jgi:hypothetical protein